MSGLALFRVRLARSSARLGSVEGSVLVAWLEANSISPDQLGSGLGSAWLGIRRGSARGSIRFGSVVRLLGAGSAQLDAGLVLARGLARRSSSIGSAMSGVTPARTKVEARHSAQLCSKLGSASRLGDRLGVRLGVQLGFTRSPRYSELDSRLGWASVRGSDRGSTWSSGFRSARGLTRYLLEYSARGRLGTWLVLAEPRAHF